MIIFEHSYVITDISQKDKEWLLLENEDNVFVDYKDADGKLLYRLKTCVDIFDYSFDETNPKTGKKKEIKFSTKEKRVVTYNPTLAKKQSAEILKQADKVAGYTTYKKIAREELGEAVKYLKVINKDNANYDVTIQRYT